MEGNWGDTIRGWAERSLLSLREPPLWMIEKMASLGQRLDPSADVDKVMRKVRFLYYDLSTLLGDSSRSDKEKLFLLRDYFFTEKSFRCRSQTATTEEEDYLIHSVVNRRCGSPLMIGLLFRSLAQHIQLNVEVVIIGNQRLLKFIENGKCQFLDILKNGELLTKAEMLELMNRAGVAGEDGPLETLDGEQIVLHYLNSLKRVYKRTCADEKLMNVLNLMVNLQSSNLKILAERALLKHRLGQPYEALLDLKRYFAFYDEQQVPRDLVELYHSLKMRFESLSSFKLPFR
jgi:regulator of sirC expression with transglutaminase-like and TPR domain